MSHDATTSTLLVLDTDIGTDVDDALALALILGSPEVELLGVTTIYGDTVLRAKLARRLARLARPDLDIPFVPGLQLPLSGRDVWWSGHEGTLFPDLADETISGGDAVSWLIDTVSAMPGEIDVLCIGPLTNVAECLRRDDQFAKKVRRLFVMGGDFAPRGRVAEHNFICDAVAAMEVVASGASITITGYDITTNVVLTPPDIDPIGLLGPLGSALKAEVELFWRLAGTHWNNPHDPVAAMTLIRPDLFEFEQRPIRVDADGPKQGLVVEDAVARRALIVTSLDIAEVKREITSRILGVCT